MSNAPNPERRSDNALLCFFIGAGLIALSYFLGIGSVLAAVVSGNDPALIAGGIGAAIILVLGGAVGGILMLVGIVWVLVRVIADSREADKKERYRDVER